MATIRKRLAKTLPPGEVPRGFKDTAAADEAGSAAIAKTRRKTTANAPAPIRERKPKSFDEERIRDRAYAIWIAEGRPHGCDIEHWLRARGEIERDAA